MITSQDIKYFDQFIVIISNLLLLILKNTIMILFKQLAGGQMKKY